MLVKRLVLMAATAALILGAGALVIDNLARGPVPPSAGNTVTLEPGQETKDPLSVEKSPDGVPAPATATATGNEESAGSGADSGSGPGDATTPTESGDQPELEVLPPVSAPPTGLPMPSPPSALVSAPLPETASARMDVVDGFPSHVLSFPDTTVIVFTGVSSSGDTLQATAEGIAELPPENVVGHFRQVLLTAGFHSEDAAAAAGQHALRLTRGLDSVSISISTTGTGGTRFSLLGNFHTDPGL